MKIKLCLCVYDCVYVTVHECVCVCFSVVVCGCCVFTCACVHVHVLVSYIYKPTGSGCHRQSWLRVVKSISDNFRASSSSVWIVRSVKWWGPRKIVV